jgi:hypothetical protein
VARAQRPGLEIFVNHYKIFRCNPRKERTPKVYIHAKCVQLKDEINTWNMLMNAVTTQIAEDGVLLPVSSAGTAAVEFVVDVDVGLPIVCPTCARIRGTTGTRYNTKTISWPHGAHPCRHVTLSSLKKSSKKIKSCQAAQAPTRTHDGSRRHRHRTQ